MPVLEHLQLLVADREHRIKALAMTKLAVDQQIYTQLSENEYYGQMEAHNKYNFNNDSMWSSSL